MSTTSGWEEGYKAGRLDAEDHVKRFEAFRKETGSCGCECHVASRSANAELLRLLERHHAVSIAGDRFLHDATEHYAGTALCLATEAAIASAEGERVPAP